MPNSAKFSIKLYYDVQKNKNSRIFNYLRWLNSWFLNSTLKYSSSVKIEIVIFLPNPQIYNLSTKDKKLFKICLKDPISDKVFIVIKQQ